MLLVRAEGNAGVSRGLIRFDMADPSSGPIPEGANVVSATLELGVGAITPGPTAIELYRVQQDPARNWQEGTATWDQYSDAGQWDSPGGDFMDSPISSPISPSTGNGDTLSILVTEDVRNFVRSPSTNFGWGVWGVGPGEIGFTSSDTNSGTQPRLVIRYCAP
jgi:hypothetical protein